MERGREREVAASLTACPAKPYSCKVLKLWLLDIPASSFINQPVCIGPVTPILILLARTHTAPTHPSGRYQRTHVPREPVLPRLGRRTDLGGGRPEPQGTLGIGLRRVPEWHCWWPTHAPEACEPRGPSSRAAGRCSPARRLAAARRPNGGRHSSTGVRGQLVRLKRGTVGGTDCAAPKADVVTMDAAAAMAASNSASIVLSGEGCRRFTIASKIHLAIHRLGVGVPVLRLTCMTKARLNPWAQQR